MARPIHSSFKYWLLRSITDTGSIMINSQLPTFTVSELYGLLVPDADVHLKLFHAGQLLEPGDNMVFNAKMLTQFSDGEMPMMYTITFIGIQNTRYNHILLPFKLPALTIDSYLGKKIIPSAIVAREWSILHTVVEELMENIIKDARALGNIFPWVKSLIQNSNWVINKRMFYNRYSITTQKEQNACDATFEAALGVPFNMPHLTATITKAALSGNKLYSQAQMLMSAPNFGTKSFYDVTIMQPLLSSNNVPDHIIKNIKDIKEFLKSPKEDTSWGH